MDPIAHPSSAHLVASLALGSFLYSAGVFSTLSFIEKPVWPLMRGAGSPRASDGDSRLIHAELNRVIDLLPPTMMIAQASAFVLIMLHAWLRGFDALSLLILAIYAVMQGWLVSRLGRTIKAAKDVPSETGEIGAVRSTLRGLLIIHHGGLAMVLTMSVLLGIALWGLV